MKTIIITGASSGLGLAIKEKLEDWFMISPGNELWTVVDWSLTTEVDVADADSVARAAARLENQQSVVALINSAGVNEIEYLPNLLEFDWDHVMDINAKGIFLVTKALLPFLRGGTILNVVSNASHVPMTASLAYCASKSAAYGMTKQMARELKKTHDITVFGVSPNKLKGTGMSAYIDQRVCELRGWTADEAKAYQLAALPSGEETDPAVLAEFIAFLLSSKERHKYLAGCVLDYGGP